MPSSRMRGELARREVAAAAGCRATGSGRTPRRGGCSRFMTSMLRPRREQRPCPLDDVVDVDAELVEHDVARGAGAEAVDADRSRRRIAPNRTSSPPRPTAPGRRRGTASSRNDPSLQRRGGPSSAGSRPAPSTPSPPSCSAAAMARATSLPVATMTIAPCRRRRARRHRHARRRSRRCTPGCPGATARGRSVRRGRRRPATRPRSRWRRPGG